VAHDAFPWVTQFWKFVLGILEEMPVAVTLIQYGYILIAGSFPGVKQSGRGIDHPPHLAPRLKKEYSYTSTPPLGLHGLF
jgi:hypothetical protein